jgi:cell division protein FtsB
MQLPEPLLERSDLLPRRLDDDLALLILLDAASPAVHRRHRGQDVHTGGEVFLDERPRERERVGVGAKGGKDEYDVEIRRRTRLFSCTHDRNALLWHTVKKSRSARDAETPQPRKRRRTIQYLLLAGGCVLLIDALVGDKGLLAMMEARARYRTLEQSLAASRSENAQLREEARLLREDPATIEEIARRELGLIRPGEKLFILKDVEPRDRR